MKLLPFCLLAVLAITSCQKKDAASNNNNPDPTPTPTPATPKGIITGKVVAANNVTAVRNATVFIADGANIYHTFTDVNGKFSLEAPAGQRELHIQSGTGKIFRTKMSVTVEAQKTTEISSSAVKLTQVASLAFVPGTYDKIQAILMDSLGYTAVPITPNELHVVSAISQFNAVFINCSSNMQTDYVQDSVLAAYVANGGSIYASDWAVAALIGTNVGSCPAWRPGGFIHDTLLCAQRMGQSGMVYGANISSPSLETYLSKNWMNVNYDLGSWEAVMNYKPAFWEVMVRHPQTQAPLLMRTSSFTNGSAGTINIGTNVNNSVVTVCHKPTGTTPVTITIPASDLLMHMGHGDSFGSCQSANGAGRIYYTTFHTQPNGLISPDMKHILDYIILNL
jgi:hypothetical protein